MLCELDCKCHGRVLHDSFFNNFWISRGKNDPVQLLMASVSNICYYDVLSVSSFHVEQYFKARSI